MNITEILESSLPIIIALQGIGDWFVTLMSVFTFLGDEEFYFLLFPVLFWCIDSRLGLRAGLILLLSGTINSYFKWIFRLPRPYWISGDVTAYSSESSFGAPSGHSQNAVAMWGLIATSVSKTWVKALIIFVIFMIGLSRMVLGVHFLLDVITGWIIGVIILLVFLRLEPYLARWIANKSLGVKVSFSFLVSAGMILVGFFILSVLSPWEIPADWLQNAHVASPTAESIAPLSLSGVISNAAVLFGVSAGYVIMKQQGGFNTQGSIPQQLLKYFIGIIGVLAIWKGLDFIFPEGETILAFAFRYLRYGLAGIWISLGAPWVFIKVKLSQTVQS
jgi:membrane-associated phospholipid phosphatase